MSERDDEEPEDIPVPPAADPPEPSKDLHVPDSPVPPLVQAILESLRPTFEGIQNEFNKYEQRLTGQQKYIEDLTASMNNTIEDRVARAVKIVSEAQYVNPQQTAAQFAPPPNQGGIGGFIQQIMGFVTSPQGMQLLGQSLGDTGTSSIFKEVYTQAHAAFDKSMIRNFANVAAASTPALPGVYTEGITEGIQHAVIGSH